MATVYRRGRIWWVRLQWHGEEIRRSTRATAKAEAERFLRQLQDDLAALDRGGQPRHTYDDAMSRFLREHMPTQKPSGAYRYLISAKVLSGHFAGHYLDQITKAKLSDFVSARRGQKVKDATIRRDLACLSSMFEQAIGWEWAQANPVKALKKRHIKESAPRVRFLTRDEYRSLVAAAPADLRPIIVIAANTGMRLGEILALEWTDVKRNRPATWVSRPVAAVNRPTKWPPKAGKAGGTCCCDPLAALPDLGLVLREQATAFVTS